MIFWTTWIFTWRFLISRAFDACGFFLLLRLCTLHTYAGPGRFTLGQRNAAGSTSATMGATNGIIYRSLAQTVASTRILEWKQQRGPCDQASRFQL